MTQCGSAKFFLNPQCLIRVVGVSIIVSNPRIRSHAEVNDRAAVVLLGNRGGLSEDGWVAEFDDCSGCDRTTRFLGAGGLVKDHSGLEEARGPMVSGNQLFKLLRQRLVLIKDTHEQYSCEGLMEGLLDQVRLGSFHQRVGQTVFLKLREREPWRAWQNQKFSTDGLELVGENYRQIQEPFFDRHIACRDLLGRRVLDFGCGNGYFSAKFAAAGASVIGLDSSEELLELANRNYSHHGELQFVLARTIPDSIRYLNQLPAASVNLIYLQDTLLLLLNPESGLPDDMLEDLFIAFRRILTDDGDIAAMEPNATFWLAGRYGTQEAPYAIVTEYRNHVFNVTPNLGDILKPLAKAGFALVEYCHPEHTDPAHSDYPFARDFPIWDFLRFGVLSK